MGTDETGIKPGWYDRPMRWAQLTLTETDPVRYDLQRWLDYFAYTRSDAACISAGGCVAYYPTQVAYHFQSPYLYGRDCFGELVEGCRKLGMVVIARTDPHAIHQDAFQAHPEWAAVDADGEPRRHWASPDLWVTCALGSYNAAQMTKIHQEIVSLYGVDGIFSNRWAGHGICYCPFCWQSFREKSGFELPTTVNSQDPAYRAYLTWRQERLFEIWRTWDEVIRAVNPEACFIPNSGGGALSDLNMRQVGELAPILFADRQARSGLAPMWSNGKNAKEYRAAMGNKPIGGIFSIGFEETYRWKDSVQQPEEIRMWVADGVANGLRPWFSKFCGEIHDERWMEPVAQMYRMYAGWEPYLRNRKNLANIGLVYSQRTAWFYGGVKAREKVEDPIRGWYQALVEARLLFEMVHDEKMSAGELQPFHTLILANTAALSEDQCQQLRDFVHRGGNLVATYETSLYDEWGTVRDDFGLADLFGVHFSGQREGPMKNSYLRLENEDGKFHPLLCGLEDAGRIINGVHRLLVEPIQSLTQPILTLIPSYPDLPMEMVWVRQPKTDVCMVFCSRVGKGQVVYFPWDIDRSLWEVMCLDHARLMQNAAVLLAGLQPVTVRGAGVLDVTAWEQEKSLTVHLVNLTNPMMMRGPLRELIPVGNQEVTIRLENGKKPRSVKLLRMGMEPGFTYEQGELKVEVPSVLDHEVVVVDFA